MQNIHRNFNFIYLLLLATVFFMVGSITQSPAQDDPVVFTQTNRWVSSVMKDSEKQLQLTIHDGENLNFITEGHRDHKPVWSKERDMIAFFRATGETDMKPFYFYRTHICVINSDGTGFRELTDAKNPNVNPTWTRDGTNKIIFNRLSKSEFGNSKIFLIDADAAINDTLLISNPEEFEWAESGLKDGRIFIFRINYTWYAINYIMPFYTVPNTQSYFLLDPENRKYYPVERPNKFPTHKLSLSPSETKVAYMKDIDGKLHTYDDAVIAYAEFDLDDLVIKNEVVISVEDSEYIDMYPRWSHDERYIVYSSSRDSGHMWAMKQYIYDLKTGKTHQISNDNFTTDMYPCFEDLPK